jgi:hypothetical protein
VAITFEQGKKCRVKLRDGTVINCVMLRDQGSRIAFFVERDDVSREAGLSGRTLTLRKDEIE